VLSPLASILLLVANTSFVGSPCAHETENTTEKGEMTTNGQGPKRREKTKGKTELNC
jgi:hypothetical protein